MENAPDETQELPRDLRFLKGLVTVLTAVMILGVITITALLVIRLNDGAAPVLAVPDGVDLPDGVQMLGYSLVDGYVVITSDDGMIRVFDAGGGLVQEIPVSPSE